MKNVLFFFSVAFGFFLASCGSTKNLTSPEVPVVTLENLPDSIMKSDIISPTDQRKLQVYLGNYDSEPLVIQRKVGDKKHEISAGQFITRDDGVWEEITFAPATKGQILSFDYTKRLAKVAFEEGDDTKFLMLGLNADKNFTLYVKDVKGKKSVKWGLYDYEVMTDPGNIELFYDPEKYESEKRNQYTVLGRSVLSDPAQKKKRKN